MKTKTKIIIASLLTTVFINAEITEKHRTGLKVPTEKEQQWMKDNCKEIIDIKLNKIAVERVQKEQKEKGIKTSSDSEFIPVEIGDEFVTLQNLDSKFKTQNSKFKTALPASVDNSNLKYFPPISSQGGQGSCSAYSTVYYQFTHNTALARNLDAKTGGDALHGSPKWAYNMVNGGDDSGSSISGCMSVMRDHGAPSLEDWPYDVPSGSAQRYREWATDSDIWRKAINYRMSNYYRISYIHRKDKLEEVKAVLANGYILGFQSYSPWSYNGWTKKAVGNDPATSADDAFTGEDINICTVKKDWGHAMTVVGYNDDIWCDINENGKVDSGEKGALKIANSWGSYWSNNGFAWVAYDALSNHTAVAGVTDPADRVYGFGYGGSAYSSEVYILQALPAYSPEMIAKFTVKHSARNQMKMYVAKTDTTTTSPEWGDKMSFAGLATDGGAYAFDGTTTECEGSFCLDLTDLEPDFGTLKRYYLGMQDGSLAGQGEILSVTFLDGNDEILQTITPTGNSANFDDNAGIANGDYAWGWIDSIGFGGGDDEPGKGILKVINKKRKILLKAVIGTTNLVNQTVFVSIGGSNVCEFSGTWDVKKKAASLKAEDTTRNLSCKAKIKTSGKKAGAIVVKCKRNDKSDYIELGEKSIILKIGSDIYGESLEFIKGKASAPKK